MTKGKANKVVKNYRIRADIAAELEGLMRLVKDKGMELTETDIIEVALVEYLKKFKAKVFN